MNYKKIPLSIYKVRAGPATEQAAGRRRPAGQAGDGDRSGGGRQAADDGKHNVGIVMAAERRDVVASQLRARSDARCKPASASDYEYLSPEVSATCANDQLRKNDVQNAQGLGLAS
ncbi:hypothetical protein GGX14DRAFT_395820 [Mycena pura]|uniref:Uncharacterized protein n=1 Tax=Mycena pura TaxID=153505 RepID=A0AAD6VG00_9AGAR|nr:hypothetical protein GGX14DRAFT_395820 [Mycena pura]